MGRKLKTGKQRRDRYYHLAKEAGYRSRSAFKLIQLNRKYSFLQSSRVLIDLCAAPGGWLQVASRNMPVSSMIIGVDLFPIKSIPNVTTFTCDITTTKCRMQLRKEMKTWKADCVLHDGAPNVGASWLLDSFAQAHLTLQALKLACEFLNKGGWFVTKVFRSKDYQPLLWVFHQMFRKVHVTKPQASRNESAEIFVVCQSFIAPDKIDAKFFDPKYIFKDVVCEETKQKATILRDPAKVKKAKAEGYGDGDYTLYHPVPVAKYMSSEDPLEVLNGCSEIILDDPSIVSNPLTTGEIKLCCKDIKVLGRKEVRSLLGWHKKYNKEKSLEEEAAKEAEEKSKPAAEKAKKEGDSESENEDDEVAKQLAEVREEERMTERRKKKDSLKKRKKLRERLHKSKELQSNMGDDTQGESLFGLVAIKNTQQLQKVNTDDASTVDRDDSQPLEKQKRQLPSLKPPKTARIEEDEEEEESDDSMIDSELDEDEAGALRAEIEKAQGRYDDSDEDSDSEGGLTDDDGGNPLMVDLDKEDPEESARRRTKLWFRKGVFEGIEDEEDEDVEIGEASKTYKQQGGSVIERKKKRQMSDDDDDDDPDSKKRRSVRFNAMVTSLDDEGEEEEDALTSDSEDEDDKTRTRGSGQKGQKSSLNGRAANSKAVYDSSDSDSDSDYDEKIMMTKDLDGDDDEESNDVGSKGKGKKGDKKSKEESGDTKKKTKLPSLDPEGLAIGTMMATSKKATREIIEHGYHRYSYGDGDRLPDWLKQDEAKHCRRKSPVTKEMVAEYEARLTEINARPIKKVAEAKARKKKRQVAKMEKLRKKAEAIGDLADSSSVEKLQQIRNLYKKYKLGTKKKEVTYVVSRKHQASKRATRPKGVKGPYKVVDPRMKKDMRGMKRADSRKKSGRKR